MTRARIHIFVLVALSWLPSLAHAQQPVSYDTLQLHPGDVVRVLVWREEDMSGDFVVDPTGKVVLPMLGERSVTDRAWGRVKDDLLRAYGEQLRNASIELTPLRRVFVLGEVTEPGMYDLDPAMSLAGAVAMAGGANMQGDLRRVKVLRNGMTVLDGVSMESGLAQVGVQSGDQVLVGRRAWMDRNSTFLVSALLSLTSIAVTLAIR
jgi:polysaccharide export outer membrane protein